MCDILWGVKTWFSHPFAVGIGKNASERTIYIMKSSKFEITVYSVNGAESEHKR